MNTVRRILPSLAAMTLALGLAHAPASAQEIVQPATPNADKLADQMRILGSDPKNREALITAGLLSVKLVEPAAALNFFQRAEEVDAKDPRIAAGRAAAYVVLQRPGEALRLFAKAEQMGLPPIDYAADRGLAYDLTGHPQRAQRDYRLALTRGDDDETVRRLALSLGITGDRKEAEKLLDAQLRKQNRSAWRAQACILAMNGDVDGAEKIATTLLPDVGANLAPFFRRLEGLTPSERAFAVHFGQLSLTPQQIADARLAPPLSDDEDSREAVQLASNHAVQSDRVSRREAKKAKREKRQHTPKASAPAAQTTSPPPATQSQPVQLASATPARAAPPPPAAATQPAAQGGASTAPREPVSQPVARTALSSDAKTTEAPARATRIGAEDDSIAQIMSRITVPASELGAAPVRSTEQPRPAFGATAKSAPATPKSEPAKAAEKPAATETPKKAAKVEKPPVKAKPKKAAPDPAKLYPARHWVQVAGGANKDTLPREWKRLKGEAPDAFKGQQAWTTPLRFTNRLLAGPFDSDGDAQDFVNKLAGKGLSAFTFTSDAGQKIEKLDTP